MQKQKESKAVPFSANLPTVYQIRVRAILNQEMLDWLGSFQAVDYENEDSILTCSLPDQPALLGLLLGMHNMGIPLISFNPLSQEGSGSDLSTEYQEKQS